MTRRIHTFGYEGLSIDRFVDRLASTGIQLVIDVRATPLSRKRGFSKLSFERALSDAEISYFHAKTLGCPKHIRDRYKVDGNWAVYTRGFLEYLAGQDQAVSEVALLAQTRTACLVCFEADHRFCHRTYVARAVIGKVGGAIEHLTDRTEFVETLGAEAA